MTREVDNLTAIVHMIQMAKRRVKNDCFSNVLKSCRASEGLN